MQASEERKYGGIMIYKCEACACVFKFEVIEPSQSDEICINGKPAECPCCGSAGRHLHEAAKVGSLP